mgnify:FL=1
MERTYTPAEIATALAELEGIKRRQREAQHRYYERHRDTKRAYASMHYQRIREAKLARAKETYQRKKEERAVQNAPPQPQPQPPAEVVAN